MVIETNQKLTDIHLAVQEHNALRAGKHWDIRVVIGDKAFSFATRQWPEALEKKKRIVVFEQPVHSRHYALSKEIHIPEGHYGAGITKLQYVQRGKAEVGEDYYKLRLNNGDAFTLKQLPEKYGKGAWILHNLTGKEDLKPLNPERDVSKKKLEAATPAFEEAKAMGKVAMENKYLQKIAFDSVSAEDYDDDIFDHQHRFDNVTFSPAVENLISKGNRNAGSFMWAEHYGLKVPKSEIQENAVYDYKKNHSKHGVGITLGSTAAGVYTGHLLDKKIPFKGNRAGLMFLGGLAGMNVGASAASHLGTFLGKRKANDVLKNPELQHLIDKQAEEDVSNKYLQKIAVAVMDDRGKKYYLGGRASETLLGNMAVGKQTPYKSLREASGKDGRASGAVLGAMAAAPVGYGAEQAVSNIAHRLPKGIRGAAPAVAGLAGGIGAIIAGAKLGKRSGQKKIDRLANSSAGNLLDKDN